MELTERQKLRFQKALGIDKHTYGLERQSLALPLLAYIDDEYRENLLKGMTFKDFSLSEQGDAEVNTDKLLEELGIK